MPSFLRRSNSATRKRSSSSDEWTCEVNFLHKDIPLELKFHRDILGEGVFARVCEVAGNLLEQDYFGLQFDGADNQKKWLDLRAPAFKQLKHSTSISLNFRVKHYPPHPTDILKQDISKYLLFHQLKRDLLEGRLYAGTSGDATFLAACIVQAEFGDFDQIDGHEHADYLCGVTLVHNQTPKIESLVYEEHKSFKGKTAQEAEALFLAKAFTLETYGIDPKPVRDRNGNSLFLGMSHKAIVTFHGSKLTHAFPWVSISGIRVNDKMLLLELSVSSTKRHLLGFKCESNTAASALWASALEQQLFFTLNKGSEARVVKSNEGLLRRRRNSFRFSGRSQKELLSTSDHFINANQAAPVVVRMKRAESLRSCPAVRRLPSVRKTLTSTNSSGSSGSDISSVSQSRRAQANQAAAERAGAAKFATYPGRRRPDAVEDTSAEVVAAPTASQLQQQQQQPPPVTEPPPTDDVFNSGNADQADAAAAAVADSVVAAASSAADSSANSAVGAPPASSAAASAAASAASAAASAVALAVASAVQSVEESGSGAVADAKEQPEEQSTMVVTDDATVGASAGAAAGTEETPEAAVVEPAQTVPDEAPPPPPEPEVEVEVEAAAAAAAAAADAVVVVEEEEEAVPPAVILQTDATEASATPGAAEADAEADKTAAAAAVEQLNQVLAQHDDVISTVANGGGGAFEQKEQQKEEAEEKKKKQKKTKKTKAMMVTKAAQTDDNLLTPVSRTKAALVLAAAFSMLLVAGVVLFFEGDLRSAAMRGLRGNPLVDEFHDRVYAPVRARLV